MKKSNKTLLQILTEELPKRGGWPQFQRELQAVQDADGEIKFHLTDYPLSFQRNKPGNWGSDCESAWLLCQVRDSGDYKSNPNIDCETLASDHATAIITREQYESALAEKEHPLPWDDNCNDDDGWIDWAGGECPVEPERLVDIKLRDGLIFCGMDADGWRWSDIGHNADIIAYRLHQPQDATTRANDYMLPQDFGAVADEADLNDCIGQTPAPVWNGFGVPPVGAEIEWREGRKWYPGTITAISEKMFVIKDQRGEEGAYYRDQLDIRAANFERDELAAIIEKSLDKHAGFVDAITLTAAALIDAGYRKQ